VRFGKYVSAEDIEYLLTFCSGMDCGMMAIFNATEREEEEWRELFTSADSRYSWKGVISPKGSILSMIEAVWEPGKL